MKKKIFIALLGLVIIVLLLGGIKGLQITKMIAAGEHPHMAPEVVTSSPVTDMVWEKSLSAVGTFESVKGVTVAAELAGKVARILFTSGGYVEEGTVLLEQDTTTEQAQLREALASVDLARLNVQRSRRLLASKAVSRSELDTLEAKQKEAEARADNIRTVIAKKKIRAPFAGKVGIRQVDVGQDLRAGDAIVTLQTLDPIYVNVSIPQQYYSLVTTGMKVIVNTDTLPDDIMTGAITSMNPVVDNISRNIQLQATVDNKDEKVLPGMFATVKLVLPNEKHVSVIPATSVLYAPYGDSVFVIEKSDTDAGQVSALSIKQKFVRLGESRGDYVAVLDGLKAGEEVVSSGVFKLRNGQAVVVDNEDAPEFKLKPEPDDS